MVAEKDIPNPDPNDRVRSGTGPDTRRVRSGYEIVYACGCECGNEQDWVLVVNHGIKMSSVNDLDGRFVLIVFKLI